MGNVSDYIQKLRKKNPNLIMGSLKEISETQKRPPMNSDNPVFDYVTSIGGIPRGVVTEIRGANSSGKTSIATQVAAVHQRKVQAGEDTGAILFLDYEYAVSEEYFSNLGIDTSDEETFIYLQPETLEEGMNIFLDMTKQGLLAMCIFDSVASASAQAEYDNEIGKMSVGLRARALSQSLRMSVGPMKRNGTALVLINHEQVKIPQGYAEQQLAARGQLDKVSPGGSAIEYYSSLRIALSKPSLKKTDEVDELTKEKAKQVTSTEVYAYAFKNKVGLPHRTGKMKVSFGKGFNAVYSAFHILVDHNLIKKKPAGRFEFPDQLKPESAVVPVGVDSVFEAIEADEEWSAIILDFANRLVRSMQQEVNMDTEYVLGDEVLPIEDEEGNLINPETGEVLSV